MNNCTFSGMRPGKEQRDLRWGDLQLKTDSEGNRFIEFNIERQTKTRTGENPRNIKEKKPKMYDDKSNANRCPVSTYLTYNEHRPTPGDLVTSLRETGEKILLPYPTRQPARSRKFAFAVIARVIKCWCTSESFSLALYHDWNSELYSKYDKCLFGQFGSLSSTVNLFYTWMEAIRVLESHNMQRWPHRIVSLKITWCFKYVNLLLIVYLLCSIKVTVFHQSLVCFILLSLILLLPYVGHSTSSVAESIKRSPTQSRTQDQVLPARKMGREPKKELWG